MVVLENLLVANRGVGQQREVGHRIEVGQRVPDHLDMWLSVMWIKS